MFSLFNFPLSNKSAPGCNDSSSIRRRSSVSSKKRPSSLLSPFAHLVKSSNSALTSTVLHLRDGLTDEQRLAAQRRSDRIQTIALRLQNAKSIEEWKAAAKELDIVEGNEAWKRDNECDIFDAPLIQARLELLDDARISCDVRRMLYLIRTSLSRNLGGMGNVELYQHSHIGTKDLIEQYIDSTVEVIQQLVNTDEKALPAGLETKDLLEQVVYARQAFGRSALLLSGGATLGMYHIGVLKALFHAKLLPRIISGASAGAIVCSVLCTRTDEEIPQVLDDFPYGDLAVFEDQDREEGALEHVARLLTQGAWIDIKHLTRVMRQLLGDITFQEAYNRTRRILNIGVSPSSVYELPRLLNYITSPNVLIWSAVAASCSVPVVFSSAHLLAKNPMTGEHTPWNPTPLRWIDGSVDNDLPMTRLAEMFNVNHFIVSQVNPHVVPFLSNSARSPSTPPSLFTLNSKISSLVSPLTTFAKSEALHRLHVLAQLGVFPNFCNKTRNMLSQKYSGDITILPRIEYRDFPTMLKNPTPAFMVRACEAGERATWPLLGRVRNHCAVELELDRAVTELRARVVFGRSGEKGWSGRPGSEKGVRGRYQGEGNRKRMVSGTHPRAWIKPADSPESAPAPNEGRVRPSIRTALSYSHAQQMNNVAAYQMPTSFIGVSTPSSVPVSSVSYSDSSTGRFLQPTVRINGPAGAAAEARLGMLPSPSTASDLGLNSVTDESEMEDSTTENEVEGEVSTPKRLFGRDK